MAKYKLLSDIVVNIAGGSYLTAGQTVTEGVEVPLGFFPSGACEPIDNDAVQKFWTLGPFQPTIKPFVAAPATYWRPVPGTSTPNRMYSLTGPLGVGFAAKLGGS